MNLDCKHHIVTTAEDIMTQINISYIIFWDILELRDKVSQSPGQAQSKHPDSYLQVSGHMFRTRVPPTGDPRTPRDHVPPLAWERLGVLPEELAEVSG